MTAPEPTPIPTQPPWTAAMLDATVFTQAGRSKNSGYDRAEVEDFKARAVKRVRWLEGAVVHERDLREQFRDALRVKSDAEGPYSGTPELAKAAVANAQTQAESELADARHEVHLMLGAARRQVAEAEEFLRRAHDDARVARPTLELPEAPNPTGDPVADLEARTHHLQVCQQILAERTSALDDERQALDEQRTRFVELLDRLETAVPDARAQIIDLAAAVTGVDEEAAAS